MSKIIGIGTDIIEIKRIEQAITNNLRFASKVLGLQEYQLWQQRKKNVSFIAKRFAAKEAFAKALKIGFRDIVTWHDIQILPHKNGLGSPEFTFSNNMLNYIQKNNYICHVSLSDERQYAVAYVIIESL
ncbi:MAG: hypothetical protein RLZZ210_241 [Pseudomonadota bacterium]|jgi:holo-[acyl-carrier protein] synthase